MIMQTQSGFNHVECTTSIIDCCLDFSPMTDNSGILKQAVDVLFSESCNDVHVEMHKCISEVFSLAQNREPRQSSLKTLEAKFFEQPRVVSDWPSPLSVVILDVLSIVSGPPAAMFSV